MCLEWKERERVVHLTICWRSAAPRLQCTQARRELLQCSNLDPFIIVGDGPAPSVNVIWFPSFAEMLSPSPSSSSVMSGGGESSLHVVAHHHRHQYLPGSANVGGRDGGIWSQLQGTTTTQRLWQSRRGKSKHQRANYTFPPCPMPHVPRGVMCE